MKGNLCSFFETLQFMSRLLPWVSLLAIFTLACGPKPEPKLTLWTAFEDKEFKVLGELLAEFEQEHQIPVVTLKVPFTQLQGKFLVAAPAGQGPDLIIGPQDWMGVFAVAELLEPIEVNSDEFLEVAVEAVTFERQTYALPMMLDCVAMIRNVDLAPEAPEDLTALVRLSQEIQHGEIRGFYYELDNFYFSWPFFAAHGAYLFGQKDGTLDPFDVGLANPGAVEAARWIGELRTKYNLVPLGANNDLAKGLFLDGKLAMFLAGPWSLSEIRKAGISYSVDPIPPYQGRPSAPLVGATGLMHNRNGKRPEEARKLIEFLRSEEAITRLAMASGRAPAHRGATRRAQSDPDLGRDIAAFAAIADQGTPMPSHPAMNMVWEPMEQALELVASGKVDPAKQLTETTERIKSKIRFMME